MRITASTRNNNYSREKDTTSETGKRESERVKQSAERKKTKY